MKQNEEIMVEIGKVFKLKCTNPSNRGIIILIIIVILLIFIF
jgi:hypothetical protein